MKKFTVVTSALVLLTATLAAHAAEPWTFKEYAVLLENVEAPFDMICTLEEEAPPVLRCSAYDIDETILFDGHEDGTLTIKSTAL